MASSSSQNSGSTPFVLGWGEWVALPDLGLPAIKAKVDTGARTSALHAFLIEPFGAPHAPMVRFGIHPVPGRQDIELYCSAPVVDRREVTSSNGEREIRYVIESRIAIGAKTWKVEITLTNREQMAYRMLIGRQAIRGDIVVDPSSAFRQPRLSYTLYRHLPSHDLVRRPLRIAVLTADPEKPFNRRLAEAAAARGHALEVISAGTLKLVAPAALGHGLVITSAGPLAHYDAVIPRIGARATPLAIAGLRQLEHAGALALNPADALSRLASPLAAAQHLLHLGLPVALPELDRSALAGRWPGAADRMFTRVVVIGRTPAAALHGRRRLRDAGRCPAERRLAATAARALGLSLAAVDITGSGKDARIVDVSATPSLATAERLTNAALAEAICREIERRVRSWVRRGPSALDAPASDDGQA